MAGINLELLLGVREFLAASRQAAEGVGEVSESFDGLRRTSDDAQRDVSDDLRRTALASEDAADDMQASFEEAYEEATRRSKAAARDIERDAEDGFDGAADAASGYGQAVGDVLGDIVQGIDGSVESIGSAVSGGIQAIGAAVGGAGGALVGSALSGVLDGFVNGWSDAAERTEKRIADMYDDMAESGNKFLSGEYVRQEIDKIINGADDATASMAQVTKLAEVAGVSQAEALRAVAGDLEARADVLTAIQARLTPLLETATANAAAGDYTKNVSIANDIEALTDAKRLLDGLNDEFDTSVAKVDLLNEAMRGLGAQVLSTMENLSQEQEFRVQISVDAEHLRRQVQGVLTNNQWIAYVDARNKQGRVVN